MNTNTNIPASFVSALLRILSGLAALSLSGIVLQVIASQIQEGFDWFSALLGFFVAILAALLWSFALAKGPLWRWELLRGALTGGLICGAIGFVGGFFGPLIFAPDANQGPLLGIFITGPLGLILGAIGGLIRVHRHSCSKYN